MKDYIVTVMARDRVGIVRDVSTSITTLGGNITHVSQTVMRGYFTLIVSVGMPEERTQLEIRQAVERSGTVGEFEVNVRPFVEVGVCEYCPAERFVLSMQGADAEGIVARTTTYLAEKTINIDDFYAYIHEGRALILAQVSVPLNVDVYELQAGLQEVLKDCGVIAHLQDENIFRATSEVSSVLGLQRTEA